ncbi:MAG TPA: tail fiber domain-containing protein [Ignavibacteria bacterium]|jgi:hypothetical protein
MKFLISMLVTLFFLLSPFLLKAQDIQFKLSCSTSSCGFSVKNSASDTLLKVSGNGLTLIRTVPSLTGSFFSVNRGNTWIFDVGNYSNRNFVSVNGSLVVTHLLTDSIGTPTVNGDLRITQYLRLSGSGCYTGTWTQCSDIRLKKNVNRIDNALNKILNLQGVTYQWRKDEFPSYKFETGEQIGLIAQEVEKVLPELVRTESDGIKSVNYSNLTAVIIEAMKQQQQIIDEQKKTINKLENKVAEQQKSIELILSEIKEK